METENHNHDENESVPSEEIEITGGDNLGEEFTVEESQNELERIEKLEQEKKKFLEEIQNKKDEEADDKDESNPGARLKYMLKQAELFAHFVLSRNEKTKAKKPAAKKKRGHHDEKDEDESLMQAEKDEFETGGDSVTRLQVQPSCLRGGQLKNHQMIGLNWLINLYENGINGILADEMGLGKTIQTIALVAFLREFKKVNGPHLIIGPKSTLGNWFREFQKWLPQVKVLKLVATKEEREDILANHLKPGKFEVCLASYEGINKCKTQLKKFNWKYIIIDEAHKIKNEESVLSKNLRDLNTHYKLLLTGTPLQNNMHELWSLLNFILPDLFASSELFDSWFEITSSTKATAENAASMEETNIEFVNQLHKILKPFLLRRTKDEAAGDLPPKKEVHLFVGLSEMQVNLYKTVLSKKTVTDDKKFYLNVLMQLRKVCNHPYLFDGVEDESLPELGAHIINASGKMIILDKLLQKLTKGKHQVLIFSQMTRVLDILEDYCRFRQYKYCRIDGDTDMDSRDRQIVDFTSPDSDKFVFLLSTRAGGLGINLATADTVILYDSDWNPQVDLQAMDRAHRIGQKNPVMVYRMITENTVEEKIVDRQQVKLRWDNLVIQQGRFQQKNKMFTRDELKTMIQHGASEIFRSSGNLTDEDIDILLERGERKTTEKNSKFESMFNKQGSNMLDLAINDLNYYTFEDVDYQKMKKDEMAINEAYYAQIESDLRTRREKNLVNIGKGEKDEKKKIVVKLPEWQFFSNRDRLIELLTRQAEWDSNKKTKSGTTATVSNEDPNEKKPEQMQEETGGDDKEKEKEKELNENRGLTKDEVKEKEKYLSTGFIDWTKDEYLNFVRACEKFGRRDFGKISEHVGTKTPRECEEYSKAFWAKITELPDYQKHVRNIEKGEASIQSKNQARDLINNKCTSYRNAKEEMEFNPTHYNKSRSKFYSSDHDKFLVYISHLEGYGNWEKIRRKIKEEPLFRFDHFFKSRTEPDLNKRMQSLLKVLEKEKETAATNSQKTEDTSTRAAKNKAQHQPKPIIEESDDEPVIKKKSATGKDKDKKKEKEEKKTADKDIEREDDDEKREKKKDKEKKKTDSASKRSVADKIPEDANLSGSRDDRYKERQAKKEQAYLEKIGVIPEDDNKKGKKGGKDAKDGKKMKQTSILTFSRAGDKDSKDDGSDEGKKGDIEEEGGSETRSPAKSPSSPGKINKKRKHENISKGENEVEESHTLKQTKLTQ